MRWFIEKSWVGSAKINRTPRLYHAKYDVCDGLSKCILLVWLINCNSLHAASCLVFKIVTYLNILKTSVNDFREMVIWDFPDICSLPRISERNLSLMRVQRIFSDWDHSKLCIEQEPKHADRMPNLTVPFFRAYHHISSYIDPQKMTWGGWVSPFWSQIWLLGPQTSTEWGTCHKSSKGFSLQNQGAQPLFLVQVCDFHNHWPLQNGKPGMSKHLSRITTWKKKTVKKSYTIIYHHTSSTIIYHHISSIWSYIIIYHHISSYIISHHISS